MSSTARCTPMKFGFLVTGASSSAPGAAVLYEWELGSVECSGRVVQLVGEPLRGRAAREFGPLSIEMCLVVVASPGRNSRDRRVGFVEPQRAGVLEAHNPDCLLG